MKTKKLKLEELEVDSFLTHLSQDDASQVYGGTGVVIQSIIKVLTETPTQFGDTPCSHMDCVVTVDRCPSGAKPC